MPPAAVNAGVPPDGKDDRSGGSVWMTVRQRSKEQKVIWIVSVTGEQEKEKCG
jgi:hypothetical protein